MTRNFAPPPPTSDDIERICRDVLGCAPDATTTLRSGAWSSAVGAETPRGPMVIRFSATDEDFRADANANRFAGPNLPIPLVHGIGQLDERWWCMSQRMPGVHLDELPAAELAVVLPSLTAMLQAMRETSAVGSTGYGGWDAQGNGRFDSFADQLLDVTVDNPDERGGGWSERLRPHPHARAIFDEGVQLLGHLAQYIPPGRHLIHQDTINFNVTVDDGRISGIFDWGCAMWGDALYDLAWFRFWNPWYPQWAELNLPDTLEHMVGTQGDHVAERMRAYLLHIGLGHIRYNAFIEGWSNMHDVVEATAKLIREPIS